MSYDILTPCHQCGRLIYIPYAIWDILKPKMTQNNETNNNPSLNAHHSLHIKQKVNFISYTTNISNENSGKNDSMQLNQNQKFNCVQLFQNEKKNETFASSNTIYFPLCQDCTTTYNFHLRNFKKLYEKSSFFIDSKLKAIPNGVFQIQYENAITPLSKIQLNSNRLTSNNYKTMNRLSLNSDFQNLNQRITIKQQEQTKKFHEPINLDNSNKISLSNLSFCPIYSISVFKIGTNYHYGTINDLRVGFYEYSPNTILETNLALYNIAHLIYTLKSAFLIDKVNIILGTYSSICINIENNSKYSNVDNDNDDTNDLNQKKEKKSRFKMKHKRKDKNKDDDKDDDKNEDKSDISNDFPLFYDIILPDINPNLLNSNKQVIVSKITKKKYGDSYYDNINNATNALFISFVMIDNAASCLPKYSRPHYTVNLKGKKIGNISYIFDWKNIENWTMAMRMLLFNLKMIQIILIRSYFYD